MGRPTNLGEVVADRGRAHIEAMTQLQTFGLVVTAEPHFAVTRMSHALVLENVPRHSRSKVENVEARMELLDRSSYAFEPSVPDPLEGRRVSRWVHQARHAVRIAQAVAVQAVADGVAPKRSNDELAQRITKVRWIPDY